MAGDPGLRAESFFNAASGGVTLTSGTAGYAGFAISGADITFNANPQAAYTLPLFQVILTHEIGHALGLGDVDFNPGRFIDDNYDPTTSATARATLTNSWAALVNSLDPSASPLQLYNVANADPGVDTPGVDILMESNIPGSLTGNDTPLQTDDFNTRHFLYPTLAPVPEPTGVLLAGVAALGLARHGRRVSGRRPLTP